MIEMNPSLQAQVLDSLILHMRAMQIRNYPASDKAGLDTGWDKLALDLSRLGVNKNMADALLSWANTQAEESMRVPAKMRILHPMEKEFISTEAYGYLLELYHLGLLSPGQMEQLIDNSAFLTTLPVGKDQMQKMVMRLFAEQVDAQGLDHSH